MSTQSLHAVATHVVGRYSQAGKLVVGIYRSGARRVVSGANTRYTAFVSGRSLPLVNDAVRASLIDVQQQFTNLVEAGITRGSERAEQAIDRLADSVNQGIRRLAAGAERVESAFDTTALTTVGSLTMPAAQVSLEIANRAVVGTQRLAARVIGDEAEVLEATASTTRPAKKAVRRTKARS